MYDVDGILMTFTRYRNERVQFLPKQLPFLGQLRQCGTMYALVGLNGTNPAKMGSNWAMLLTSGSRLSDKVMLSIATLLASRKNSEPVT